MLVPGDGTKQGKTSLCFAHTQVTVLLRANEFSSTNQQLYAEVLAYNQQMRDAQVITDPVVDVMHSCD